MLENMTSFYTYEGTVIHVCSKLSCTIFHDSGISDMTNFCIAVALFIQVEYCTGRNRLFITHLPNMCIRLIIMGFVFKVSHYLNNNEM